jgi:uncharacterized protein YaiI (UPF0178 family)
MTIWVDADACPKVIKELLFKTVVRKKINLVLVANAYIPYPVSSFIQSIQVSSGFDKADQLIIDRVQKNDLVITQDIHLAHEVLSKHALALNPRGELFHQDTIKARLSLRDVHEQMRSMGEHASSHGSFGDKEKMAFANALDKYLTKIS